MKSLQGAHRESDESFIQVTVALIPLEGQEEKREREEREEKREKGQDS